MKFRRVIFTFAATAAALIGSAGVPAHAGNGCVPNCAIAGTVVGSIIHPGIDFNFKGVFTDGNYPGARFNIEGPYPAGSNGTLRITGHGAPNISVAVVVEFNQVDGGFHVSQVLGEPHTVNADFSSKTGSSYTGQAFVDSESSPPPLGT